MTPEFENDEINKMHAENVDEPAPAKRSVPNGSDPRKDEIIRFWVIYAILNEIGRQYSNPIPYMYEWIDLLEGETVFLTLGANNGYLQIKIEYAKKNPGRFQITPRSISLCPHALWSAKCPCHDPKHHGRDSI